MITKKTNEELKDFQRDFMLPDIQHNTIFSTEPLVGFKNFEYDETQDNNVLLIGDKENKNVENIFGSIIAQCNSSYIVRDIDGKLYNKTKRILTKAGYSIQCVNFIDVSESLHYNPMLDIQNSADVDKLAINLSKNMDAQNKFEEECLQYLYKALITYLVFYERNPAKRNLYYICDLLKKSIPIVMPELSPIDLLFKNIDGTKDVYGCLRLYSAFSTTAQKLKNKVFERALIGLDIFRQISLITCDTTIDFDNILNKKGVLFIIVPSNNTYNVVENVLLSNLIRKVRARKEKNDMGVHLNFILRDFRSMNKIASLPIIMADLAKNNAAMMFHINAINDLRVLYEGDGDVILDEFQTIIYTGTDDSETNIYMADKGGYITIKTKKGLFKKATEEEVKALSEADLCQLTGPQMIVFIRGTEPLLVSQPSL